MYKYSSWGKNITLLEDFPRSGDNYKDDEVDFGHGFITSFPWATKQTITTTTAIIQPISKQEH